MSEEYENYSAMMEEVEKRAGTGDPGRVETENDLSAAELHLQRRMEIMWRYLEDLNVRVRRIEERLDRVHPET